MTFRARIAIAASAAVALAVVLASVLVYFAVRGELRGQIDETLEQRAAQIAGEPLSEVQSPDGKSFLAIRPGFGEANTLVQLVKEDGSILGARYEKITLPPDESAVTLAAEGAAGDHFFADTTVSGLHVRVLTFAYGPGHAIQVARPLTEVDDALGQLRLYLLLVALGGIGLAAAFGLVVSRAALAPVRRLGDVGRQDPTRARLSSGLRAERIGVAVGIARRKV